MKNRASILCTAQAATKKALQTQAQQMLPALTALFSDLQYSEIGHQRISQQSNESETEYQGLTRAQYPQFGSVMIKWQLNTDANQGGFDLNHEADVLKSLDALVQNQDNLTAIAPPILAYDSLPVQILGQSQQLTIVVMPYYRNGSLADQLSIHKHSLLTNQQKQHFIMQSAHLIANIHKAGWLHNDIKPSNILLDGFSMDGTDNHNITPNILLTDFASAQPFKASSVANLAGTPAYLAPERWQGQGVTVQSDIYAFGIMMVEILMGERPFKIAAHSSDPMIDWATKHCQQPIPTLPLEYGHYQSIINKALAKRVERRYQSMEEIMVDLERL